MVPESEQAGLIPDWSLLERAQQGDETAWRWLQERHYNRLVKMAALITGSPAVAQDIAQETLIKLVRHRVRHRDGSFRAYLSTIACREAYKDKKRHARQESLDSSQLEDEGRSPLDQVLDQERDRNIARAIRSLDRLHREILVLRFYGENTYEEIAQIKDIPLGTVKSRIYNAVQKCRQILWELGVTE